MVHHLEFAPPDWLYSLKPFSLIALAGIADISTSLAGWRLGIGELITGPSGSFVWVLYWSGLAYFILKVKSVPAWVKVWFPRAAGILLLISPISNLLNIISVLW